LIRKKNSFEGEPDGFFEKREFREFFVEKRSLKKWIDANSPSTETVLTANHPSILRRILENDACSEKEKGRNCSER
jgi:hypothetical protein